jgi:hypothetical protein
LDPFFGSGTTGAVAKKLKRRFIGIERSPQYVSVAQNRIDAIPEPMFADEILSTFSKRDEKKVAFGDLLTSGYLKLGQTLYSKDKKYRAIIKADSTLAYNGITGSIHKTSAHIQGLAAFNGWEYWYYEDESGILTVIDRLRIKYREEFQAKNDE